MNKNCDMCYEEKQQFMGESVGRQGRNVLWTGETDDISLENNI